MEVIQIPKTDQLKPVPNIRVRTYFIIRDRLNEQILRDALDKLIRNHWRKLGARLATRREDGLLEYHLPRKFEENYALFNWTSQQHAQEIATLGLPKATPPEWGITMHPHTDAIEHLLTPSEWPIERKVEPEGAPLLFVHLSQYSDACCLAINYPHALADQFGLSNIMKAWLGLTKGIDPPQMIGVYDDPLPHGKTYVDYEKEGVSMKGRLRVRRYGEYPLCLLASIPDLIIHKKEVKHTMFIPLTLVESLREKTTIVLQKKYGEDPGISQNDIVTAMMLKFSRIHHKKHRMLSFTQTMNLRGRIPALQGASRDAFIHNCAAYSTARFIMGPSTPLSEVAYQNRLALTRSSEPEDAEIGLALVREMVRRGQPNLACEPFERFFHVTSWTAAWKDLDFSSVSEVSKENTDSGPKFLVLGSAVPKELPQRFVAVIICKTSEGYYVNHSAPPIALKLIKEYLEKDPTLEEF